MPGKLLHIFSNLCHRQVTGISGQGMNIVKQILEGVAMPMIGVNTDFMMIAANSLAIQAFPGIEDPKIFAGFLEETKGLKEQLTKELSNGTGSKGKFKTGSGADYSVTSRNIGAMAGKGFDGESSLILMTFEDRSPLVDLKSMRIGFVANVSHEIRSPLTAISGFVETLQGPAIEDVAVRSKFLALMSKEVARMTNLVSDLLSLSQVEAKERRALKKKVFPAMVVGQAIEAVSTMAEKWKEPLVLDIAPDLPAVIGRQDDLIRVFINLLENAIHYNCENGEVRLTAQIAAADNPLGKPAISIAVADEGEGIEAKEIPLLTQRFYRVDKSRARDMGGTGLGLAIVKHILVRHQGKLVIESEVGQGSVFTVYLPISSPV